MLLRDASFASRMVLRDRAKQADGFSSRIASARLLRPGRFCGTMRSACAVRNLSYSSLVYTPRKVKDGKEIIRTMSARRATRKERKAYSG